ncbi:type II secretion system F family protein, partial [Candidatus Saccharibacteria bacterium]|nr:type II secretion system F family protein [Candidatus Saccharibacteria bacterium]
ENLHVVAEQIHKNNIMTSKVRSALLYPAFLIVLLILVGSGIGLFLLPKLADIFNGLNMKLPWYTKALIVFGQFWGKWGILITLLFMVTLVIIILLGIYTKTGKKVMQKILYSLPGVNKLLFQSEIARFGFILGSLLDAGLPVVEALDSLSDSMATKRYRDIITTMKVSIEEGNTFATTFEKIHDKKAFPGPIRQLIVSAEKSGSLSETLLKMSQLYEDKAEITAKNLETMIEPIILVLIAIGVLFVALAVIVPIYSLIGGLEPGR